MYFTPVKLIWRQTDADLERRQVKGIIMTTERGKWERRGKSCQLLDVTSLGQDVRHVTLSTGEKECFIFVFNVPGFIINVTSDVHKLSNTTTGNTTRN